MGTGDAVYIADHPKRCLKLGIDIHETFAAARRASLKYIDIRMANLGLLREAAATQKDPDEV